MAAPAVGDYIDPMESGNSAIDIKSMLNSKGYIIPQSSVDSIRSIPAVIMLDIEKLKEKREKILYLNESKGFNCSYCNEKNYSQWRSIDGEEGEFLVCGNCNKVVEVR